MIPEPTITQYGAKREQVAAVCRISEAILRDMPGLKADLSVKTYMDQALHDMVLQLRSYVLSRDGAVEEEVQESHLVPASWWQHVKHDLFPRWALKRWPVRYSSLPHIVRHVEHRLCPHLAYKVPDGDHMLWLNFVDPSVMPPMDVHQ